MKGRTIREIIEKLYVKQSRNLKGQKGRRKEGRRTVWRKVQPCYQPIQGGNMDHKMNKENAHLGIRQKLSK